VSSPEDIILSEHVKESLPRELCDISYTRLLKSSIDISSISHFYRFTVMDTSFHASENDFICEDCGKCLKSRSGLRRHRLTRLAAASDKSLLVACPWSMVLSGYSDFFHQ
jgi:hypothetical protein